MSVNYSPNFQLWSLDPEILFLNQGIFSFTNTSLPIICIETFGAVRTTK